MWYYERETRELVRINQCELIESFLDAQRDYAAGVALALMSETTEAVLGEREVAEPMFRLLLVAARAIKAGAKLPLALAYFAFWTVRLGGWMPRARPCSRCGASLTGRRIHEPGAGCSFAPTARIRGSAQYLKEALQLARRMSGGEVGGLNEGRSVTAKVVDEVKDHMLNLIEEHIEKKLHTRKMLAAAVSEELK